MADEGLPIIGPLQEKFQKFGLWYEEQKKQQGIAVRMVFAGVPGAVQGTIFGAITHSLTKASAANAATMPPAQRIEMEKMANKTLGESIRPLVALFVVQSALTEACNHYRKDKDDMWNMVLPALGAGGAYGLAQGTPAQAPVMAIGFAGFSALFYKLGWGTEKDKGGSEQIPPGMTRKQWKDSQYQASLAMLTGLGLQNYHKNLKQGLLTDNTIMLWNDSTLQECKIPPGPRLLILHHIQQASKMAPPAAPKDRILSPSHPLEEETQDKRGRRAKHYA